MRIFTPETIIMGFLKGFFSQEELYGGLQNEFIYVDNREDDTLRIRVAEEFGQEFYESVPSIVIQEGGFSEQRKVMDNRVWHKPLSGQQGHRVTFIHPLTIHCCTRYRGTSRVLQSAVCQSIVAFRKAIYEFGIDNISTIQGQPPREISRKEKDQPELYDATINFRCMMDNIWTLKKVGDLEEKIRICITAALDEIEFDDNGNIITPSSEWFEQCINIT